MLCYGVLLEREGCVSLLGHGGGEPLARLLHVLAARKGRQTQEALPSRTEASTRGRHHLHNHIYANKDTAGKQRPIHALALLRRESV